MSLGQKPAKTPEKLLKCFSCPPVDTADTFQGFLLSSARGPITFLLLGITRIASLSSVPGILMLQHPPSVTAQSSHICGRDNRSVDTTAWQVAAMPNTALAA